MIEPPMPSKGMIITDWCMNVWRYIRSIRPIAGPGMCFQETPSGTIISINRTGKGTDTLPPFTVTLSQKDKAWKASISRGIVAERIITKEADTVKYWEPSGMLDKDGKSIPISITSGDGLFVVVSVNSDGKIEDDGVTVEAAPAGDVSVSHYIPAIGKDEGAKGTYKFRLGKFEVEGETGKFIPDMAGSNIDHLPILPKFKMQAGDYDIFKKYDIGEKAYKTKGLTEKVRDYKHFSKTIHIDDTGDELQFETWGQNLDLKIYEFYEDTDGKIKEESAPKEVLCFREGLFLGTFSDSDLPGSFGTVVQSSISKFKA
jgi:hypothetical protein